MLFLVAVEFDLNTLDIIMVAATALIGFLLGKAGSSPAKTSKALSGSADEEDKARKEILQDQVKQLEAKVATLEKALDEYLKTSSRMKLSVNFLQSILRVFFKSSIKITKLKT